MLNKSRIVLNVFSYKHKIGDVYRDRGIKYANICTPIEWKQEIFWKALLNKSCLCCRLKWYTLSIISLNGPITELWGRPLKNTFHYISKVRKIFFNCRAKHFWNNKTFQLIPNRWGWSLKVGVKKCQRSFKVLQAKLLPLTVWILSWYI